jgi:hypothetical protein
MVGAPVSGKFVPISPSQELLKAGEKLSGLMVDGFKRAEERRAAGLPPEPISAEAIEFAGRVARRSFWTCYEDDDDVAD